MASKRFYGEAKDREAAQQLGLGDEYTIFLVGTEADYVDDLDVVEEELREQGVMPAEDVIEAAKQRVQRVMLPQGYLLVGMSPLGKNEPCVYGVVKLQLHD